MIKRIVYMGTPEFAVPALQALIDGGRKPLLVVTQPDRAKDRGKKLAAPPVKELAEKSGIKVLQPERIKDNQEFFAELAELEPDIIVVAAYGRILPREILELPAYGCINIHASLLPRHRGASPIHQAILEGDRVTGVTIMQMAEGLDTGDLLSQAAVPVEQKGCSQLTAELAEVGGELLLETLKAIEEGKIEPKAQDDALATYSGIIKKEAGKADFAAMSATDIERRIRAFEGWPGVFCHKGEDLIKLKAGEVISEGDGACRGNGEWGSIIAASREGIDICCKGGSILRATEIQAPGKKAMKVEDYLRGNPLAPGTILT